MASIRRSTTESQGHDTTAADIAEVLGEEVPLTANMQQLYDAYGCSSHATFKIVDGDPDCRDHLVDYEPLKLSSFRVCCVCKGSILVNPVLLIEQLLLTVVFAASAFPVYWYFNKDAMFDTAIIGIKTPKHLDIPVSQWLAEQEGKMRAFAMIMTMLATFLLSFYTSLVVGRWWVMRTGGVGGIKAATVDLEILLYQNVTQDEKVLSAVRRYGRTSLMLIFLWRRGHLKELKKRLTGQNPELLNNEEVDNLLKWNHCLHETIWAWQSAIVTMLHKEGKIKSDQLFQMLLQKCVDGRAAVQCVHTHLAVRPPMQYVHMLGLLVKMHNTILAIIMGLLFGAAVRNAQTILCVQCFMRTVLLPFLFNAIMLINAELSDPFDGGLSDFPGLIYQGALEKDCKGLIAASQNMPDWLEKRARASV